jgi:hypothetical protein
MDKRSKHKLNVHMWLIKVINSCTTLKQLHSSRSLVDNYRCQYNISYVDDLYRDLVDEIHYRKRSL